MAVVNQVRLTGVVSIADIVTELSAIRFISTDGGVVPMTGVTVAGNFPLLSGSFDDLLLQDVSRTVRYNSIHMFDGFSELVFTFPAPTDVNGILFASCDNEASYPVWYIAEVPGSSYVGNWIPLNSMTRGSRRSMQWPGPRTMPVALSGLSNGAKFFDTSVQPPFVTINADGTQITAVSNSSGYYSFTGSRPFMRGSRYYFEAKSVGAFMGLAPAYNQAWPGYYFGVAQIPGSIGFGDSHQYINYVYENGTNASWVTEGSPISPQEWLGYHIDMVNMQVQIFRNGVLRYTFIMANFGLAGITEWYLGSCSNASNSAYTLEFRHTPQTIQWTPPAGAIVGMGAGTPTVIASPLASAFTQNLGNDPSVSLYHVGQLTSVDTLAPVTLRPVNYAGFGYIKASVMVQGTPNYAVARRVVLYYVNNDQPIRETVSDPVTGLFEFKYLDEKFQYNIMVQDTAGGYITTSSGPITPKRMPGTEGRFWT